jgi:hypothetical protein
MRILFVIALAAACSNSGDKFAAQQTITLDRDPVGLGNAFVGTVQSESLQIINQGRADLTITSIKLTQLDGGAIPSAANGGFDAPQVAVDAGSVSDPLPVKIGGTNTGFVQFNWGPKSPGTKTAQLTISSDDPAKPVLITTVTGCAVPTDGGPSGCVCADAGPDGGC